MVPASGGGDSPRANEGVEWVEFQWFGWKRKSPALLQVSGAFGKVWTCFFRSLSGTGCLIARLVEGNEVPRRIGVMGGTHGLSDDTEGPQTQSLPDRRRFGYSS